MKGCIESIDFWRRIPLFVFVKKLGLIISHHNVIFIISGI